MYHNDNSNTPSNTNTTKESSMIDLNTILSAALNNAVSMAVAPLLQRIEQLERHRDELRDRIGQLQFPTTPTPSPDTSALTESDIEAMVERKIHDALEDIDIDNMVDNALENLDIERMVEDAVDNIDFNEKVDLDDLTEALKSNTDWASMIESIINNGSFTFTHR